MPPRASTSLVKQDFAGPPTAGLHGISAMFSKFKETAKTFAPSLAAAIAASHPACPNPTVITSYLNISLF